jgi:RimJ/RimL family protein N-acetyltransferase
MFEFLKDQWWKLQYPWPRSALKKLRPLKISVCPTDRLSECERLFEQNIPHGLPAYHLSEYSNIIRSGTLLVLIVEDGETLVGTFSLTRYSGISQISLSYVLVDPKHHRSGVGTTIFFASVAMLSNEKSRLVLGITALPTSEPFYQKLGFSNLGTMEDSEGQTVQIAYVYIWPGMAEECHRWLGKAGARLEAYGSAIPTIEPPEQNGKLSARSG